MLVPVVVLTVVTYCTVCVCVRVVWPHNSHSTPSPVKTMLRFLSSSGDAAAVREDEGGSLCEGAAGKHVEPRRAVHLPHTVRAV